METLTHVWSQPPKDLTFADHEVHVWRAQLELPFPEVQRLRGILTRDEVERADRFRFELDQQRFIAARGILRSILSRYTGIYPGHLRFHYNQYGKPALAPGFSPDPLNFNLSHSGGMAVYAVTRNMQIGVDLERICSDVEPEEIARNSFSIKDVASLHRIPPEGKLEAFYNCWTRKEAYIKAQGKGLSLSLDSFEVSFAPGEPARLLRSEDEPQARSRWTVLELTLGAGYKGAVAVKGIGCSLKYWEWNP